MRGQQSATGGAKLSMGKTGRTTGRELRGSRGGENPDEIRRQELEQYLVRHDDGSRPRPTVGVSVPVTVDEGDCERARFALRRLSAESHVPEQIEFAAVGLEVSLERPLDCIRRRNRSMTLEFDVADCVLMALALQHVADYYPSPDEESDSYRNQAQRLLDRVDRSTPESFDVTSTAA